MGSSGDPGSSIGWGWGKGGDEGFRRLVPKDTMDELSDYLNSFGLEDLPHTPQKQTGSGCTSDDKPFDRTIRRGGKLYSRPSDVPLASVLSSPISPTGTQTDSQMMSPGPDHTAELTLGSTDVGSAESDPTWTPGASRYLLISYTGGSQGSDKVLNTLESYCKGDCQFSGLALDTWIVDSEIATVNLKEFIGSRGQVTHPEYFPEHQHQVQFDDCRWSKNLLLQLDHFLSTSGQSKAHVTLCTQDEALWLTLYRRLPTDTDRV
ncbi:hypothetical protein BJ085DRAFT_33460 [Dimargaris cristalligena]|uniref:Uncharacterized protein n=1 Tax=Dimargaris cristalligena TaxID=215637 RepID=A0A4V1J5J1_9FUNG|nr:hypothetical protein BJ085DRAFT_33460 [Dimargaris cristalligena]|eukprot:RKP39239.1 hypothetical protein BJ085DRAFT_33460 [Dimargaris cristalligena]